MALKINNRRTYTIDDYINDKNRPAMYVGSNTAGLRQVSGSRADQYRNMMAQSAASQNQVYGPPAPLQFSGQTSGAGHGTPTVKVTTDGEVAGSSATVAPIKPSNNAGTSASGGGATAGTGGGETVGGGLTEGEVVSTIVTSDTKNKMDASIKGLEEFFARGFQYNEKESPLYAILQKQMADEARLASGRAYSRAVANAGGFGSSYATLAAEEASRQVMEGWDEQQLALYQAAKEEWESQFQSKMDEYNFWNARYQQELAEKNAANSLFTSAVSALRSSYGITYDEAAMTADLKAMGLNDEQIKAVLANQKQYSEAMASSSLTAQSAIEALRGKYGEDEYNEEQMRLYLGSLNYSDEAINEALSYWKQYSDTVNETKEPEKISDTAQNVLAEWQAQYGTTYSEGLMRAFFAGRGYSEEAINEAVNAQRDVAKGELLDQAAMVKTYQDAATYGEMLNEARRSKIISDSEWENAMRKNSEILRREYVGAGSLSAETLDEAAEMVRDKIMTKSDFEDILKNIFRTEITNVRNDVGEKFNNLAECKKMLKKVISLFEYVDDGTITNEDLKALIKSFAGDEVLNELVKRMTYIEGVDGYITRIENENNKDYKRAWNVVKEALVVTSVGG